MTTNEFPNTYQNAIAWAVEAIADENADIALIISMDADTIQEEFGNDYGFNAHTDAYRHAIFDLKRAFRKNDSFSPSSGRHALIG